MRSIHHSICLPSVVNLVIKCDFMWFAKMQNEIAFLPFGELRRLLTFYAMITIDLWETGKDKVYFLLVVNCIRWHRFKMKAVLLSKHSTHKKNKEICVKEIELKICLNKYRIKRVNRTVWQYMCALTSLSVKLTDIGSDCVKENDTQIHTEIERERD